MRFVAGRGAVAKHLVRGAAVAERHQEDAGRGAVAKCLVRGAAVAECHREDANQHRGATAIGSASAKRHREDSARREMRQGAASGRC